MIELEQSQEVADALAENKAVVALESTVISHGLPYPENREIALAMEAEIRNAGAVPATIAILNGRMKVGLTEAEIDHLASAPKGSIAKVSTRDLPAVLASRADGATTVAATMKIAARAGIPIFATGGIGGVHPGGNYDVSADLIELSRTPVAVVCAGAKAILDLPATLEVLETHGVPVVGYGTDTFPAFWSRDSALPLPARVDEPDEAARIFAAWRELGTQSGLLITVPVPEEEALARGEVERVVSVANREAAEQGVVGSALTPFLLARIAELTDGRSIKANKALLLNNARIAAQIAIATT